LTPVQRRIHTLAEPTVPKQKRCAEDGQAPPLQSPVKWSELLKRVWDLNALDCQGCHARMTAIEDHCGLGIAQALSQ